jgi:hypothetical protein
MLDDEAMTRRALDLLGSRCNDPYEAALAVLREDTRDWWADLLARDPEELDEGEEPAAADAEGLRRSLKREVLPWFEERKVAWSGQADSGSHRRNGGDAPNRC